MLKKSNHYRKTEQIDQSKSQQSTELGRIQFRAGTAMNFSMLLCQREEKTPSN